MFNIWVSHGIFYGFSDESIIHFMRKKWDPDYTEAQAPPNGKLRGTGLVISPEEYDLDESVILAGIAERRIVPETFPEGRCTLYSLEKVLEFINHPTFLPRYKHIIQTLRTVYGLPKMKPPRVTK